MLCDPSHICGRREGLAATAQKAADLSYDGLFMESHVRPDEALSDAAQQVTPEQLGELLAGDTVGAARRSMYRSLKRIWSACGLK